MMIEHHEEICVGSSASQNIEKLLPVAQTTASPEESEGRSFQCIGVEPLENYLSVSELPEWWW